ncbi:hypothetical protein LTR97_004112 [Elasticomyces elasticus]|uniref:DUF7918 domain-containing protein n=1 Tax=Elasticomyces elasticus TaxID=574655 RepID=A0AAN7W8W1_9PEZI|nr:hypothetical protein LTR97_004112 [Elasticomyces elasticus]
MEAIQSGGAVFDSKTGAIVCTHPRKSKDAYHVYTAPTTSEHFANGKNIAYIIAPDENECWAFSVTLPAFYPWKKGSAVSVKFTIDGTITRSRLLVRPKGAHPVQCTVSNFVDYKDGKRVLCGFEFQKVESDDDPAFLPADQELDELAARSRLDITLQAVMVTQRKRTKEERKQAFFDNEPEPETMQLPSVTSERLVEKYGKAHFTRYVRINQAKSLRLTHHDSHRVLREMWQPRAPVSDKITFWNPIKDDAGIEHETKFTVFYTSRAWLEKAGILQSFTRVHTQPHANKSQPQALMTPDTLSVAAMLPKRIGKRVRPDVASSQGRRWKGKKAVRSTMAQSAPMVGSSALEEDCDDEEVLPHTRELSERLYSSTPDPLRRAIGQASSGRVRMDGGSGYEEHGTIVHAGMVEAGNYQPATAETEDGESGDESHPTDVATGRQASPAPSQPAVSTTEVDTSQGSSDSAADMLTRLEARMNEMAAEMARIKSATQQQ